MKLMKTKESDLDELVRISIAAFDSDVNVGAAGPGGPPEYDSKTWHRKMMKQNHLYTAVENDKIVGGAILFVDSKDSSILYIGRIFVDPEDFRKGYGIQIMSQIESMNPDIKSYRLDTPIWNIRTNNFYKKVGYEERYRDQEFIYYEYKSYS